MEKIKIFILKALKKVYSKLFTVKSLEKLDCENNGDVANKMIFDLLMKDEPCMIARFGSTELANMANYLMVKTQNKQPLAYVKGEEIFPWWWETSLMNQMQQWSGFFPPTQEKIEQFCEMMFEDMKQVDVLGSWLSYEKYFINEMNCDIVHLRFLEPFWSENPWTKALENKKVLVLHPFAETIKQQYKKREGLFENNNCLPKFSSLETIKSVQTLGQNDTNFNDWFEALQWMKDEIDRHDYDVCLIGAGAYGFPLAAHVKRMGKKGIHVGGALQLFFGIKGKRWEDPHYGVEQWKIPEGFYMNLMNEHWVRPNETETPKTAEKVEGSSYW